MRVEPAISAEEYLLRIHAVRSAMAEHGFDALLMASPENIYYLAGLSHQGYFSFTLLVLPLSGPMFLVARTMEEVTVARRAPQVVLSGFRDDEEPTQGVVRALQQGGLLRSRLGVEMASSFFPPLIWEGLREALPDVEWGDGSGIVDDIRFVKSPAELACIRQAAAISDRAIRTGLQTAGVGVNEREVAAEIYRSMVLGGSEYPGFAPLLRTMDRFREEHATWEDRVLVPGDSLMMELSGSYRRYHAPLSRLVCIGKPPPGMADAAKVAHEALEAVGEALRPGILTGDVYLEWERVVRQRTGVEECRRHHCGYSVGIGFPPSWVGGSTVIGIRHGGTIELREGMVFHLLSWLFGLGPADYVISDTAVVTASGAEFLTTTSAALATT